MTIDMVRAGLLLLAVATPGSAQTPEAQRSVFAEWLPVGDSCERFALSAPRQGEGIRVTGDGKSESYWYRDFALEPGRLYRIRFNYRSRGSGGCVISGPTFANLDHGVAVPDWADDYFAFVTPPGVTRARIRLGQRHVNGAVEFSDFRMIPMQPVHGRLGEVQLGEGERIDDRVYRFDTRLVGGGQNYSRPLDAFNAAANSGRWVFSDGQYLTYRHEIQGGRQKAAHVEIACSHYTSGRCVVEIGRDGTTWAELGSLDSLGSARFVIPASWLPSDRILVRLRAADRGEFQIQRYAYVAGLDGGPPTVAGSTIYLETEAADPDVKLVIRDLPPLRPGGATVVRYALSYRGREGRDFSITPIVTSLSPTSDVRRGAAIAVRGEPSGIAEGAMPLDVFKPGNVRIEFQVSDARGKPVFRSWYETSVAALYATDYGVPLNASRDDVLLWWCDATRKVARRRPAPRRVNGVIDGESGLPRSADRKPPPEECGDAVYLAAARNEFEAVQLIVRPRTALAELTAAADDLHGPGGATIPASEVRLLRVRYVKVTAPSDSTGVADEWPDPLPPFDKPITVPAGVNQPIWVLVRIPETAAPGDYTGRIRLSARDFAATVPIRLHVWDFALPRKPHTQAAFGMAIGNAYRYHGITRPEDQRALFAKYMQSFADHRVSPYDPTPFDPIRIRFRSDEGPPRAEVDFTAFDRAMQEAIDRYRITCFKLHIPGMGGGDYQGQRAGAIGRHATGSAEYEAMFASAARQIEAHLREKGWLDLAYVYWFDEPEAHQYDFVRQGMERLHRSAPGICRMLTEEPVEPLFGCVDLWCPVTPNYNHEVAEKRRQKGERFWWYVCCGPHAPYCALFIDHAATDLRVWLWQTWQRKIEGILIWETLWWTSPTAFPDSLQNPYEDPMSYVGDSKLSPGTRKRWGNGDGRFLYPPEAAAAGSRTPVLEAPVSSLRWEMLREGIEDVDYLHILRATLEARAAAADAETLRQARALLEVPPEITRSATEFTMDSRPIYERRAAIATQIERLQGRRPSP